MTNLEKVKEGDCNNAKDRILNDFMSPDGQKKYGITPQYYRKCILEIINDLYVNNYEVIKKEIKILK